MKNADVSVVIPCFNCAETIERAVHSVTQQTLRPAEVILINDASTDNTLEILAKMVEGDADGINGLYDNKYVFIFKFSEGQIISLREYTSDLLVETRLYKQKVVADD